MAKTPRFRGENFRGKWSLGSWSEKHILDAINSSDELRAVPYGKSEVGPTGAAEKQAYWDEYKDRESFGKRPDVLVFERSIYEEFERQGRLELVRDLPNRREDEIKEIVENSLLGVEAEASIWQGEKMPHYGRDWHNRTGRSKPLCELGSWTAPTVIVKDEDMQPLINWQEYYGKPIYIVHLFYDMAFMLNFARLRQYIADGVVCGEVQDYGKAKKVIYKTYYGLASTFGEFTELAEIVPFVSQTKGGKFEADLYFDGGTLVLSRSTVEEWLSLEREGAGAARPAA